MFWSAFTIGLLGSLHCIGMCGPIAMALPLSKQSRWGIMTNSMLYNLGRAVTYSVLGLFIGIIGEGVVFAGFQRVLSILTGIGLLIVVLFSIDIEQRLVSFNGFGRFFSYLKMQLALQLKKIGARSTFFVGLLNGLLPCGLVYLAMAGALTTGNIWASSGYMFLFGMGTMPLMLLFLWFGNRASQNFRHQMKRLYPVFLVGLAIWFIYRGAHFYLPPDFRLTAALKNMPMCH